jgi:hypothetical protein
MRGAPPAGEGSPPDRIRRHFGPDDIERWAEAIGPGRLIGVQYEDAEPADRSSELRYRAIETNPPPQLSPTNWVYVGTVAPGRSAATSHHRVLPLTSATFRLPSERAERISALRRTVVDRLPPRLRTWMSSLRARAIG